MNTARLHFSPPVLKLATRAQLLGTFARRELWARYRLLRRHVLRRSIFFQGEALALKLAKDCMDGTDYGEMVLSTRLALAYSRQTLAQGGAAFRAERVLIEEAFSLLHQRVRELLGLRTPRVAASWRLNVEPLTHAWLAVCDGSFKRQTSAAGILVYDEALVLRAEVSLIVQASSSVEAELRACHAALATLYTLGARRARVLVDAQSVVCAFHQRLPLHLSLHEGLLLRECRRFDALEVLQVSRIATQAADRLAAALSKH